MAEEEKGGIAIGIDLGTTYSCVGVWRDNAVEIIANDMGERTTPSYVAFQEDDIVVGEGAKSQAATNPTNTIFDAKRLIGRNLSDKIVQDDVLMWPFKVIDGGDDKPSIQVMYQGQEKVFTPEEISAMVLVKMKETAESYLGQKIKNAVITVPAYFNDSQRHATKSAGAIAGLNVLRIINEPTAAAIAYGMNNQSEEGDGEKLILVFDLGGGTFDVSLLAIEGGVFEVRATAGDTHLGGEDFDQRIMKWVLSEFAKKHKGIGDPSKSEKAMRRLRTACERAKRTLSSVTSTQIEVDSLWEGIDCNQTITRARFEDLCGDYFRTCMDPVNQVLADQKIPKQRVDEIVLVGGSTRIPKVQQMLQEAFHGKAPNVSINPDEAVAYGAAVQASILMGDVSDETEGLVLLDVASLSIGVETAGGMMSPLIKRGTTIPCEGKKLYSTNQDNQTAVEVCLYEGERPKVSDNNMLGKFELEGIPAAPAGVPRIEVVLKLDSNGMLEVSAQEKASNKIATVKITNTGRLSADEVNRMVAEAAKFQEQDLREVKKDKARQELQLTCSEMREAINDPKLRINKPDWDEIDKAVNWVQTYIQANPEAKLKDYIQQKEKLEEIVDPILLKLYKGHGLAARNCGIAEQRKRKIQQLITQNAEAKRIRDQAESK